MSRTDAHSNRSISEKLYRAELARHKAARTAETVDEAIRDELAVEHAEIVETGLGTKIHDTLGVGWWFQPRKRTSAELENAIVLAELQREHYLVERPEAVVRWTSGRWSSGQEWEDSLNEHDPKLWFYKSDEQLRLQRRAQGVQRGAPVAAHGPAEGKFSAAQTRALASPGDDAGAGEDGR